MFFDLKHEIFEKAAELKQFKDLRDELNRLEESKNLSSNDFQFEPFWDFVKEHFEPRLPDLNNEYKGCVYLIDECTSEADGILGSGTLISNQEIITAKHVFEDYLDNPTRVKVVFDRVNKNHRNSGQVVRVSEILAIGDDQEDADFVKLALEAPFELGEFQPPAPMQWDETMIGQDVIAVGYGNMTPYSTSDFGVRRVSVGKIIGRETVMAERPHLRRYSQTNDILTMNGEYHMIANEDSGGPVYLITAEGLKVIAIHRSIDVRTKINVHTKIIL